MAQSWDSNGCVGACDGAVGADRGQHRQAQLLGSRMAHHDHRGGAVGQL